MSVSSPSAAAVPFPSRPPPSIPDSHDDHQTSPSPSVSPSFPDASASEVVYFSPHESREEGGVKVDSSREKIKKKFSELDIRGAMADLDIRKGTKRTGIEEFYIQLDEPHRMFWCPGGTVRGQVNLVLDRPVKTQYIILKLIGQLSVSMLRENVESTIIEEELVLWGTKIQGSPSDRSLRDDASEFESPKKQKDEWETGLMEEGEHPFPFEFELPTKSMPSSIDFGKGSITYTIRCIHQRPPSLLGALRNKLVTEMRVPILDIVDVAAVDKPRPKIYQQPDHSKKGKATGSIRTDIELDKAGYLKGEQIRLKIRIRHTKPIKNLTGAVITLYRMSRFDSPRGEPSTFRKDLAQTICPIICAPPTLEYFVTPRIQVPTDTFPTIHNVAYISFKYYLEVIIDLNPKHSLHQTSTPQDHVPDDVKSGPSTFIDTTPLLRKGKDFVHVSQFEIVVGTIDTEARDLDSQLARQGKLLHHGTSSGPRRLPMATFPSAPDLSRRRDSGASSTSSASTFARHPPPPPPFTRGSSVPSGITLAGGPRHSRSPSASSRASISKSALAQRELALLPSAPPESNVDLDASAPPIILEPEESPSHSRSHSDPPTIHISRSHESLTGLRIEIPADHRDTTGDDEYLASLQSRVSAPGPSTRSPPSTRIRRRPVSRELESEEASAPPLDDTAEDTVSVSDRVSVASTLPLYTERG